MIVFVVVCWLRSGGEHYQPRLAVEDDAEDEKDEEEQEEEEGTS